MKRSDINAIIREADEFIAPWLSPAAVRALDAGRVEDQGAGSARDR